MLGRLAVSDCLHCDQDLVCESLLTCGADEGCHRAVLCGRTCDDPACVETCPPADPMLCETALMVTDGVDGRCDPACGEGADWSCIGDYGWRLAETDQTISVQIVPARFQTPDPIVGAEVLACRTLDPDCVEPAARGTTGEGGAVTLSMAVNQMGFDGHFLVRHPDFHPAVLAPGRPLQSNSALAMTLLTTQELEASATMAGASGFDPDGVMAMVIALDCRATRAEGVAVRLTTGQEEVQPVYVRQRRLDPARTATDESGVAIFPVVPIDGARSVVTVEGFADGDTRVARYFVPVHRGHLTTLFLFPDTEPESAATKGLIAAPRESRGR